MARYTYASGLTWVIGGCVGLVLGICTVIICFLKGDEWSKTGDGVGAAFCAACIAGLISLFVICMNVVDVVEPEGATVRELVRAATR
jgi:uncharacterized membrane protein